MGKMSLKECPHYCQLEILYSYLLRWKLSSPVLYSFICNCEHVEPHEAINQKRDEGPTELFL